MNLREARFKNRLTQWELSKFTGVHQSRISLIENNYSSAKEEEKEKIAKELRLRPDEIQWP